MDAYSSYIRKLDAFLRRFYLNRAFGGLLILLCFLFLFLLLFAASEYFSFFSSAIRRLFFWLYFGLGGTFFILLCLIPFLQAFGVIRRMSYRKAARYLASRFPDLDDKIYNIIDLHDIKESSPSSTVLLDAAISQVCSSFATYRFERVVRLKSNRIYFYSLFSVILIVFASWLWNPGILASSDRIIHYNRHYERTFPFSILVQNSDMHVSYGDDFLLELRVAGDVLPSRIFLLVDGQALPCKKLSADSFTYLFKKVQRDIAFQIVCGEYESDSMNLLVDYGPLLSKMRVVLHFPPYTRLGLKVIDDALDFRVPSGTRLEWELMFDHARSLSVYAFEKVEGDTVCNKLSVDTLSRPVFSFSKQVFSSFDYILVPAPFSAFAGIDTLRFSVSSIPDAYPRINVRQFIDSSDESRRFFSGRLADDYGFSSLYFHLDCSNPVTGSHYTKVDTLFVDASCIDFDFTYYLDFEELALSPGDEVSYGFEVRDNDAVSGYKASYSETFVYRKMSEEEIRASISGYSSSIDQSLSSSLQSVRDFEKEMQSILEDLLSKSTLSWQDRKNLELLLERREEIRGVYESVKEEIRKKEMLQSELYASDPELDAKKKELQELFDRLFDNSVMSKLDELQRLMEEHKPDDELMDVLEKLGQQGDFLAEDLERNLELYRRLELEDRLQSALEDVRELQEQSAGIEEEMSDLKKSGIGKEQARLDSSLSELKKHKEKLEEDLKNIEKMNFSLEEPVSFGIPDSLLDAIELKIEETSFNIGEGDAGSAKQTQRQTTGLIESLAENLENQMQRMQQENLAEDAAFIRILLKSIVRVSFAQENLMNELSAVRVNDPYYAEIIRKQSSLISEIGFIIDSVRAISKRQPQVALTTDKEIGYLLDNTGQAMSHLLRMNDVHYRRYGMSNRSAMTAQQYTMASLNNLALLLSESLDNMQKQLQMKRNSSGSQKGMPQMSSGQGKKGNMKMPMPSLNPGNGETSMPGLRQMQEFLNRQLEALEKMLQDYGRQNAPDQSGLERLGGGKSGGQEGSRVSEESISESFARAAAQQEMIRRMLQKEMQDAAGLDPQSASELNRILGDMERTERDLVNKILNDRLMARQKNIETRLLEAENAELKREKDEKRESKEGRQYRPFGSDSVEFLYDRRKGIDVIRENLPVLQPYYQRKVQDYFFETE